MGAVTDALDGFGRSRLETYRVDYKPSALSLPIKGKGNLGYCEGCKSYKPAPRNRKKGWRCSECKT